MLASVTEMYWSWIGFFLQVGGIACDCVRMIIIDHLTIDVKLDTLSTSILHGTAGFTLHRVRFLCI